MRRSIKRYPASAWLLATLFTLDPLLVDKIEAESESGCWLFTGAAYKTGRGRDSDNLYGRVKRKGKTWYIHRWVYTLLVGTIPRGHEVHHRDDVGCLSTLCCNPRHLEDILKINHFWYHQEISQYT